MKICVFCGSRSGHDARHAEAATRMGALLAARGDGLVYGGGHVGLMGTVADSVLEGGGEVIGVIPRALAEREIEHKGLTELIVVETMHERKAAMADRSDGFVALPGGAGTLEEIFEQWTWAQLGVHAKPVGFLNVNGYYDPMREMIERIVAEGFIRRDYADMLVFAEEPEQILSAFENYVAPADKLASSDWKVRV